MIFARRPRALGRGGELPGEDVVHFLVARALHRQIGRAEDQRSGEDQDFYSTAREAERIDRQTLFRSRPLEHDSHTDPVRLCL